MARMVRQFMHVFCIHDSVGCCSSLILLVPNRGFVNFRATYSSGAERVYGAHCHAGDTVGVLLDCDSGRISYFIDGVKYGEHILNDLGCAFENVSPFGFNADGCGSGGAGEVRRSNDCLFLL